MEKVIPGDGAAGLHQVCSCAILNLTEKSLGCMDFSSKETTVVLLVERRYNRECQTQLWSQSQSLFEIIGCAWILKEMEISGGCVSWCHFIPEGLRIPSKQEQSFKTCLWDFLQWLYWLFPCIIILGLFISCWADFLPSSSYHCVPLYLSCTCHFYCFPIIIF